MVNENWHKSFRIGSVFILKFSITLFVPCNSTGCSFYCETEVHGADGIVVSPVTVWYWMSSAPQHCVTQRKKGRPGVNRTAISLLVDPA